MPSVEIPCCGDTYVRYYINDNKPTATQENYGRASVLRVGSKVIQDYEGHPGRDYDRCYAVIQFNLKKHFSDPKAYAITKAVAKTWTDRYYGTWTSVPYSKWLDKSTAYESTLTSANSDIDFGNIQYVTGLEVKEPNNSRELYVMEYNSPRELETFGGFVTIVIRVGMSSGWDDRWDLTRRDIQLCSRDTQYPPVLYLEYEEKIPSAPTIGEIPNAMYLEKPFSVSWVHNDVYNVSQKSAEIQWSANGGTWNTVTTTAKIYTFPGNTFPAGTIRLRIRTCNEFGKAGPFSQVSFVAQKTVPSPPTINYPTGVFVNALASAVFNWLYNGTDGIGQSRVEIIWRKKGASAWNTVQADTGENTYTFPADTFWSGVVEWGIRTYNMYGNPSDYSYASFTAIGQSEAAVIGEIENACLTEVTWETEEQNIYQIDIHKGDALIYSSGECPGYAVRSHKPDLFLEDGDYVCMVRVKNNSGLWSEWATRQFTISTEKPAQPGIFVGNRKYGVEIRAAYMGGGAVVYKGIVGSGQFKPLSFISSGSVYDYELKAGVQYEYFVRTFFADGGYSDSRHRTSMVFYGGFLLSPLDDMGKKVNLRRHTEAYIPVSVSVGNGNIYTHYLGREFPVRESGGFRDKTISLSCYVDKAEYAIVERWYMENRDLLLLSDVFDYAVSISSMSAKNAFFDKGYTVQLEFTVIDRDEGVVVNA